MSDTVVVASAAPHDTTAGRGVRLSWGALLGGIVVALGVWLLLTVLGLAIGLSAIDPSQPASARTAGLTTGIWSLVVPLVALFVGGLVASRTAGIVDRPAGAIHGAVLWALATILSILLMGFVVRNIVGGAAAAVGSAASAASTGAPVVTQALGIDARDVVAPLNERLRAEGKPTVRPEQLEAAVRDAAAAAVREGRFDKQLFVTALSENTALSPADVRELADRAQMQLEARTGGMAGVKGDLQQTALRAADATGTAMWWLFLGMALSLGAAVFGATVGVSRQQRTAARGATGAMPVHEPQPAHS